MFLGDTVKVHLTNKLTKSTNGTSIHFHGIRQNYTNSYDGVVSLTQCPTAKGSSYTYTWKAVQYGTSWYHSHFGLQAFEGAFGGIVINGPATANYDEDLGAISLLDWDKNTADYWWSYSQTQQQPSMDNALINGTNVFGQDGASGTTGKRFTTKFEAGKSYRMRLINAAVDTHFKFSIDNHDMQVIANDLVPIKPFNTSVLSIAMGKYSYPGFMINPQKIPVTNETSSTTRTTLRHYRHGQPAECGQELLDAGEAAEHLQQEHQRRQH